MKMTRIEREILSELGQAAALRNRAKDHIKRARALSRENDQAALGDIGDVIVAVLHEGEVYSDQI